MKVLITGGRDFCEQRDGADHMDERRALAFALDFVDPSELIVSHSETGASRWARIWAARRGVLSTMVGSIEAGVSIGAEYAVCFQIGAEQCRKHGMDCYEVRIK